MAFYAEDSPWFSRFSKWENEGLTNSEAEHCAPSRYLELTVSTIKVVVSSEEAKELPTFGPEDCHN
jgi:hypothetical protein